jgi:polysaccharide biosynthesis/export protein
MNRLSRPFCRPVVRLAIASVTVVSLGCATKSFTKPYSDVMQELKDDGQTALTVEENRALFLSAEQKEKERLSQLVQLRATEGPTGSSYRIGIQDKIDINVFDVPELNLTALVNETGVISLPLIGGIQAAGLTDEELKQSLTKALSQFVKQPQVSVAISEYGSQKVAILGAVQKPGTYSLRKGQNSIVEILGEAGGATDKASNFLNFIPVEFTGNSGANDPTARARLSLASAPQAIQKSGIEIAFDQLMGTGGGIPLEVPVRGGDILVVPEAGRVTVDGEVEKRGTFELGSRMSLLGALGASGGITYGAKVDEVEVIRAVNGASNRAHYIVDLQKVVSGEEKDILLRDGDIVRVPSHSGRRLRSDTFETITKVINFGVGGSVSLGP